MTHFCARCHGICQGWHWEYDCIETYTTHSTLHHTRHDQCIQPYPIPTAHSTIPYNGLGNSKPQITKLSIHTIMDLSLLVNIQLWSLFMWKRKLLLAIHHFDKWMNILLDDRFIFPCLKEDKSFLFRQKSRPCFIGGRHDPFCSDRTHDSFCIT